MARRRLRMTRRGFLGSVAVTTGAACAQVVPRHVVGGKGHTPPSETVYVAGVGASGMGGMDIQAAVHCGAKVVALCDVDDRRAKFTYESLPKATVYRDFRRLFEKEKGIDAVIVGTPDHTHAVITLTALAHGKHVYCEKPLAHTMREVRTVTEAAREAKVATQMGNQGRSFPSHRSFCECIASGAIGEVREVHVVEGGHLGCQIPNVGRLDEDHPVPPELDWNLWLGPAPHRKYNPMYLPGVWRGWSQFGCGMLGDWVCHLVDPVFCALDLGAPESVVIAEAEDYDPKLHRETFPLSTHAIFTFPARGEHPPVTLHWYDGMRYRPTPPEDWPEGEPFIPVPDTAWSHGQPFGGYVAGDKGKIVYGSHGAIGWRLVPGRRMEEYKAAHADELEAFAQDLTSGAVHQKSWLEACKGGPPALSNFDYGGPLAEIAMLGNIALRFPGQELAWDAKAMRVTNHDDANEFLHYPYPEGWTL